jgi:hypothetical protein
MKKLFLLFLVMAVMGVGLVFAAVNPDRPPGAPVLDMALSGDGLVAVIPDTVPRVSPVSADTRILAIPDLDFPLLPLQHDGLMGTAFNTGQYMRAAPFGPVDYPLLC